jgi:hypothetical protein
MKGFIDKLPISSQTERIKRTPINNPKRGYWLGKRGCSTYIPVRSQKNIILLLHTFDLDGIPYINGMVDFRKCSYVTICLQHMSTNRQINFAQCDKQCADIWNTQAHINCTNWTGSKIKKYRKENSLTWHERNDRVTCDLVPRQLNSFFSHLGGIAECKRAKY